MTGIATAFVLHPAVWNCLKKCGYKESVQQHGTCLHSLSTCDLKFLGAKCT